MTTDFPVEEVLLREPNLWTPGRKPVGNVKIDWSHPIAKRLIAYWLPSSGIRHNLVSGGSSTITYASGYPVFEKGSVTFSQTVDEVWETDYYPSDSDFVQNTISIHARIQRNVTPNATSCSMGCNDGSNHRLYFGLKDDSTVYAGFGNTGGMQFSIGRTVAAKEVVTIGMRRSKGGEVQGLFNGERIGTLTAATFSGTSTQAFHLTSEGTNVNNDNGFTVHSVAIVRGDIQQAVAKDLHYDPYSFLIPA